MHYVLVAGIITLIIYFRFGKKPLGYILALAALLALARGLIVLAIPAGIIAWLLLRGKNSPLKDLSRKIRQHRNNPGREGEGAPQPNGPGNGQPAMIAPGIAIFLDPEEGRIQGVIREGPLQDQPLSRLREQDFISLLTEFHSHDRESEQLLIAYLDKEVKGWQAQFNLPFKPEEGPLGQSNSLMPRDALIMLGLDYTAGEAEIKKAHRQLMKKFHPDQGGSPFLAARLNMAKDVLLKNSPTRRR